MKNQDKYLTGIEKFIFFQYFKIYIFFVYFTQMVRGKITFRQFIIFVQRMLLLYDRIKVNKVVKTRGVYKTHIYLPAFPTQAFFISLDKFLLQTKNPAEIYPTSMLLSMGRACNYKCPHCYQRLDSVELMPIDVMRQIARQLQELNIGFINIEGGEPLLELDRLILLLKALNPKRSEIWINTNGSIMTRNRALKMNDLGVFGVMVSLHHWDKEVYDKFTGIKGSYDNAILALEIARKAGLSTAINCTGTQDLIFSGGFEKIMQIAKDIGCAYVQLIHEKPAGAWLERKGVTEWHYVKKLCDYHLAYSRAGKFAKYPAISSQAFESRPENFGCTAGGIERFYINAGGEVQPCEFTNVSFGNVCNEPFLDIYRRMRQTFDIPRTNWLCCTERDKIVQKIHDNKIKKTPLPKNVSENVISNFNRGEKTVLYRKMKLYE